MSKRIHLGEQFQKLEALRRTASGSLGAQNALDEQKPIQNASKEVQASGVQIDAHLLNGDESLSTSDTVHFAPCLDQTVSRLDPVQNEHDSIHTGSRLDPVQVEPCEKRTVSNLDSVQNEQSSEEKEGTSERTIYFTRVPHSVLRGECHFGDPLDFMIYLHLFTYSHGFGRKEASMSQAQLERFTGAAKNTVKRGLDRLVKEGWIQLIEEYEHGRMSRKWRVYAPEDRGGPKGKKRGSSVDRVQNEQDPHRTGSGSKLDTQTVSKIDTYIDSKNKEKSKNSLSAVSQNKVPAIKSREREIPAHLQNYLSSLKPERKRLSELSFYRELCSDFSPEDLSQALNWLQENGLPGSAEPCHSPMAFLASGGIRQVVQSMRGAQQKENTSQAKAQKNEALEQQKLDEEARAEEETKKREERFLRAFPDPKAQERLIAAAAADYPVLSQNSTILRSLAISCWWENQRESL